MSIAPGVDHAEQAYDAFAPFYDDFTGHHDYDAWIETLEGLARRHGLSGRRVLDVACGTGKSTLPLVGRGYAVTGCDGSAAMLALAREKLPGVALHQRDLREIGALGRFDLVCCIDDGLNYLLDPDEVASALRGMAANLAAGGLVLFDVNTLSTYRGFFALPTVVEGPARMVVWQGRARPTFGPGDIASATVDAYAEDRAGGWSRVRAEHFQRHHPAEVIASALAAAGLERVAAYGQDLTGAVEPWVDEARHTKIVYVARPHGR